MQSQETNHQNLHCERPKLRTRDVGNSTITIHKTAVATATKRLAQLTLLYTSPVQQKKNNRAGP